ncbi:hypothetical protein QVH35_05770 [Candidatus Nitrosotenuis chungbukensis]|uniref:hypothetical protein n=1 Tax=Candidatus Nitrosotenuis chungbukensis TaxID=1353246 RepID=UPI0026710805|nr:hypothetical protein [Candidatus Nitrosotenuis chungbukensis]WKT58988.1 hypothetical protein QVH35_05770 [Candidatus Nitrosotenuis chungbukensis]
MATQEWFQRQAWPQVSEKIDGYAIQSEELLKSIIGDIANILKVTKIAPQKITIYTADSLKAKAYHFVLDKIMSGQTNMGIIMKDLIANKETEEIKKNPDFVQRTIKDILSESTDLRKIKLEILDFDEKKLIASELSGLIRADFNVEMQVFSESDPAKYDPKNKSKTARPFKPAILIE